MRFCFVVCSLLTLYSLFVSFTCFLLINLFVFILFCSCFEDTRQWVALTRIYFIAKKSKNFAMSCVRIMTYFGPRRTDPTNEGRGFPGDLGGYRDDYSKYKWGVILAEATKARGFEERMLCSLHYCQSRPPLLNICETHDRARTHTTHLPAKSGAYGDAPPSVSESPFFPQRADERVVVREQVRVCVCWKLW